MGKKIIAPDVKETIGKKIRELRKNQSNKNYIQFAEQLNDDGVSISKNTLQRIESGGVDYSITALLNLLNYLGVKPSDFFKDCGL